MAETQQEKRETTRDRREREARESPYLTQEGDPLFSRAHNPVTHGDDPVESRQYGDV